MSKWKLADLVVVVAGFAGSFASLRFYWRHGRPPMEARPYDYFAASATFLGPLAWTLMVLAMIRTPRGRWSSHPAVVVGLAVATVLLVQIALGSTKYAGASDWVWIEAVVESWQEDVAEVLIAALVVAAVCGRLRTPQDGLEAAGAAVGLSWVASAAGVHLFNLLM